MCCAFYHCIGFSACFRSWWPTSWLRLRLWWRERHQTKPERSWRLLAWVVMLWRVSCHIKYSKETSQATPSFSRSWLLSCLALWLVSAEHGGRRTVGVVILYAAIILLVRSVSLIVCVLGVYVCITQDKMKRTKKFGLFYSCSSLSQSNKMGKWYYLFILIKDFSSKLSFPFLKLI